MYKVIIAIIFTSLFNLSVCADRDTQYPHARLDIQDIFEYPEHAFGPGPTPEEAAKESKPLKSVNKYFNDDSVQKSNLNIYEDGLELCKKLYENNKARLHSNYPDVSVFETEYERLNAIEFNEDLKQRGRIWQKVIDKHCGKLKNKVFSYKKSLTTKINPTSNKENTSASACIEDVKSDADGIYIMVNGIRFSPSKSHNNSMTKDIGTLLHKVNSKKSKVKNE